jgi:hypothetical protein
MEGGTAAIVNFFDCDDKADDVSIR